MEKKDLEHEAIMMYLGIAHDLPEDTELDDACSLLGDWMYDKFGRPSDHGIDGYWSNFLAPILEDYFA